MAAAVSALAARSPAALFASVDADAAPDLAAELALEAVPSFFFFRARAAVPGGALQGADAAALTARVEALLAAPIAAPVAAAAAGGAVPALAALAARVDALISSRPVMLAMKGTPAAPKCKFSRMAVETLTAAGADFGTFDILTSPGLRQALKDKYDWPTYPMAFIAGQFIGGVDVLTEMAADGSLKKALEQVQPAGAPAMSASVPQLSRAAALAATAAAAATFTGLTPELETRLRALVSRSPVMLFMKGHPSAPQCGFSDKVVQLLRAQGLGAFDSFDILSDIQVREGLKVMSAWPTFPQLYVKGELIGGLDVLREMVAEGGGASLAQQLGVA